MSNKIKALHGVVMSNDILLKFTNANILINDKAYERIQKHENSLEFADSLIDELLYSREDIFIITEEFLDKYLKSDDSAVISSGNELVDSFDEDGINPRSSPE